MSGLRVEKGKVVFVTYRIVDLAGKVLEQVDIPVGYVHGDRGYFIPRLERALEGAAAGEAVTVRLEPHEGFGEHRAELTFTDKIQNVPSEYHRIGAEAEFQGPDGKEITMRVAKIRNGKVTLDGNHPFAGKIVIYHIMIDHVRDAGVEELKSGQAIRPEEPVRLH